MMYQRTPEGRHGSASSGFTLLEMVISITVLALLAKMLVLSSEASSTMTSTGNVEARIMTSAEKALNRIVADLRMTGEQTIQGRSYPYVYDDGVAADGFESYSYVPAPMAAAAGDSDAGVMRSIILALPSDLDGNGRPELDANGNGVPELDGDGDGVVSDAGTDVDAIWDPASATIVDETRLCWDHSDISYKVVVGPTGENELVRLVANGTEGEEVLARGVERIQFDTPASAGFTIPTGSVRVRIYFRVTDEEGHVFRSRRQALVRPRNS